MKKIKAMGSMLLGLTLLGSALHAQGAISDSQFHGSLQNIRSQLGSMPMMRGGTFIPAEIRDPVSNPFLEQLNRARRRVYGMAKDAVVTVHAGRQSLGSGFIVDPKGIVITNGHVVRGSMDDLSLTMSDGRKLGAKLLAVAPGRDIAILQIQDEFDDWPALPLGKNDGVAEGDIVFALGNPGGLGISLSQGTVSKMDQNKGSPWTTFLQSDIQIDSGNSGGPLLNHKGEVLGMNTAITGPRNKLALSIKIDDIKAAMREYKENGKLVDGTAFMSAHPMDAHGDKGYPFLWKVKAGSLADKAGLKVGDMIVGAEGLTMGRDTGENTLAVMRLFARKKPGETVKLQVVRAKPVKLKVGASEADALMVGRNGTVFLGSGNMGLLRMMMFGGKPKLSLGPVEYDLDVKEVAEDGSHAVFKIAEGAGWKAPEGELKTEEVTVAVEEYKLEGAPAGAAPAAPKHDIYLPPNDGGG